jgi:ribosome-binding protein aMBF1 (putative translation factor)
MRKCDHCGQEVSTITQISMKNGEVYDVCYDCLPEAYCPEEGDKIKQTIEV